MKHLRLNRYGDVQSFVATPCTPVYAPVPMVASILDLLNVGYLITSPLFLVFAIFWLWMLVDSLLKREWIWAAFIFFSGFTAIIYFFFVYRATPSATRGFDLPGAT